ncbi:hypothetical protein Micbo1qcDRAFT_60692 [Microdochium bolleyi]|uniref:4'-phosphopantetheinyl transferase domain-containing protein n=1 Tax=Microdochium bolleyi TaxID=196109 RepID=A0A136J5K7_9PEZI|nr:hypothetical protein Micbo1qcDRAFT_60692 [Microdochium bolleyi]
MLPLSIGNDICHIPRIIKILRAQHGSRFVHRILTKQETLQPRAQSVLQCILAAETKSTQTGPDAPGRKDELRKAAEYIAGRFAAKEAAIKAHPQHNLTYHQIEIQRLKMPTKASPAPDEPSGQTMDDPRSSGPPVAKISPGNGQDPSFASVSISHDGEYAMAVCLSSASSST